MILFKSEPVKEEPKEEQENMERKPVLEEKVLSPVKTETIVCDSVDVDVDMKVKEEPTEILDDERTRPNLRERPPPPPKS